MLSIKYKRAKDEIKKDYMPGSKKKANITDSMNNLIFDSLSFDCLNWKNKNLGPILYELGRNSFKSNT